MIKKIIPIIFITFALLSSVKVRAQWVQLVDPGVPFDMGPISAISSIGPNIFVAGRAYNQPIFISTDNGINWTFLSNGPDDQDINDFATMGTYLFVGIGEGISLSIDSRINWNLLNFNSECYAIKTIGTTLFAGAVDTLVFMSKDSGAT